MFGLGTTFFLLLFLFFATCQGRGHFNRCSQCSTSFGNDRCCCEGLTLNQCMHEFGSKTPSCYDQFDYNCCGCTSAGVCGVCRWDEQCDLVSAKAGFRCVQPGSFIHTSKPNFLMWIGVAMGSFVVLCIFSLAIRACARSTGTVYHQLPSQPQYGAYAQPQYGYQQQQQNQNPPQYGYQPQYAQQQRPPAYNPSVQ